VPGPFSASIVEAVGACTRALAGVPDADATLTLSDAATLGGLRAFGDRLAVSERFHDAAIHRLQQPAEAPASEIFSILEQARLDVLGVRWLAGIGGWRSRYSAAGRRLPAKQSWPPRSGRHCRRSCSTN
jgi:cobalamin biosynthesis protein CobT